MSNYSWAVIQPLIGGMCIGAERAFGSKPKYVIDYDNIANSNMYVEYINDIKGGDVPHLIFDGGHLSGAATFQTEEMTNTFNSIKDVDVVVAVPICSGLSTANTSKTRGADAVQNLNQLGITEFALDVIKPKCYIYENACQLLADSALTLRHKLEDLGREYGYVTHYVFVNTENYGIPQSRKRSFVIMYRADVLSRNEDGELTLPVYENKGIKHEGLTNWFQRWYDIDKANGADTSRETAVNFFQMYVESKGQTIYDYCKDVAPLVEMSIIKKGEFPEFKEWYTGVYNDIMNNADPEDPKNPKVVWAGRWMGYINKIQERLDTNRPWYHGFEVTLPAKKNTCGSIFARSMASLYNTATGHTVTSRDGMRLMGMPEDFPCPTIKNEDPQHGANLALIGQNVPTCTAEWWCTQVRKALDGELPTLPVTDPKVFIQKFSKPELD